MSVLETSTNGHAVPTFSIYESPTSKEIVKSLKNCFLEHTSIDINNPPAVIRGRDGWVYTAVYDTQLPVQEKLDVIISFQQHSYGRFAIIRKER